MKNEEEVGNQSKQKLDCEVLDSELDHGDVEKRANRRNQGRVSYAVNIRPEILSSRGPVIFISTNMM